MSDHRFQVHLGGIITLLAQHLYANPQVFVREVVQNAHDAVRARHGADAEERGLITVELLDGERPTLQVSDNGIGLDADDVHRFLATIGASSKRPDGGAAPDPDFIGRFGIGLLSCFIVADEIVLHSRSAKPGAQPVLWHGRADGTYTVSASTQPAEPGTVVYLRGTAAAAEHFEPAELAAALRRYAGLLRVPVRLVHDGTTTAINVPRPWRGVGDANAEQLARLRRQGEELLDDQFMDALPLGDEQLAYEGAAFFLRRAASALRRQHHRVYVKDMFLADDVPDLLPPWAFFVRVMLDSHRVQPTASRETLHQDGELEALRESLDAQLRRALQRLAANDRARFADLVEVHGEGLRQLAAQDPDCCRLFAPWLAFPTTHGDLTLHEFRARFGDLLFAASVDEFRQLAPVARAQGMALINAGFVHSADILAQLPLVDHTFASRQLAADELGGVFAEVPKAEHAAAERLAAAATRALAGRQLTVAVRSFAPAELPALLHLTLDARLRRQLRQSGERAPAGFSAALQALSRQGSGQGTLYLNWNHPLLPRLAQPQVGEEQRRLALRLLHVHALQAGHHPLESEDLQVMSNAMLRLVDTLAQGPGPAPGTEERP